MPTGAELLCKNLMLLLYNWLALLLMRSPLEEVRAMTPWRVHELLLGRSLLACLEDLDAVWVENIPDASWPAFDRWLSSNVQDYNDLATYFLDPGQESVRYEVQEGGQPVFSTLTWKVRLSTFTFSGWNRLVDEWKEIPQFSALMHKTTARVVATTEQRIGARWEQRQPAVPGATRPAPQETFRWYEMFRWYVGQPLEDLKPTRRARFKKAADRELFSVHNTAILVRDWQWQKGVTPYFLVYETAPAPEDYVIVSAADFNTTVVIRDARLNVPEKLGEVELPKRKGLTALMNDFPLEEQLSGDQLYAYHAMRNLSARRIDKPPSSPDMWGWVEVFDVSYGPNVRSTALAVFDDLEFE
jgi:hypothetical protein